jgi:hypothetical protein
MQFAGKYAIWFSTGMDWFRIGSYGSSIATYEVLLFLHT